MSQPVIPSPSHNLAASSKPFSALPQGCTAPGISIHLTHPAPRMVNAMAASGFKVVRLDVPWAAIEPKKGTFDFAGFDGLLAQLQQAGLTPMVILGGGNAAYTPGGKHQAGFYGAITPAQQITFTHVIECNRVFY
jgi:hypothetical protein